MKKVIAVAAAFVIAVQPMAYAEPTWDFAEVRKTDWSNNPNIYGENLIEEELFSENRISLTGEWDFALFNNPYECEQNLNAPMNGKINVPGAWQMQGFDFPKYSRERYPWAGGQNIEFPMIPEDDNPTGLYKTTFDVPENWSGKSIYLSVGRGGSAVYAYVNGKKAGYGEGMFLPKTFDITDFVHSGENTLVLEVIRYSESSYLENRDGFNLSGLFDDVCIIAEGTALQFVTDYDGKNGIIDFKSFDFDKAVISETNTELKIGENIVAGIEPWSVDNPKLYTLTLTKGGSQISRKIGFCRFEAAGKDLLLNGEVIKINGIKYSGFDPQYGFSGSNVLADLEIMKNMGVNTVITDGVPLGDEFYTAADSLGLLVIDSGLSVNDGFNGDRYGEFLKSYVRRMIKHSARHCSVAGWNLGYDGGELLEYVRTLEKRPVVSKNGNIADAETEDKPYIILNGGIEDADKNFGGLCFSDEGIEAERELYEFELTDKVNGKTYFVDGEIKNYLGERVFGGGTINAGGLFDPQKPFTVELWGSFMEETSLNIGNSVNIVSNGSEIGFSVKTKNASVTVRGNVPYSPEGGISHMGAVYAGNELRLFIDDSFKDNREGTSNGATAGFVENSGLIKEIRTYDRALNLDELCAGELTYGITACFTFDNIKILKDKSEKYLAYGGDFGDYPNSGSGVGKGVFNSYREQLPEGKVLEAVYKGTNEDSGEMTVPSPSEIKGTVTLEEKGGEIVVKGESFRAAFCEGSLTQYQYNGKDLLASPSEVCLYRSKDNLMSGIDTEGLIPDKTDFSVNEGYADVEFEYNFYEDGAFTEHFRVYADGSVSVYNQLYGDGFTFCGNIYELEGNGETEYFGYPDSTYQGLIYGTKELRKENLSEKICPYLLPSEFGNHHSTNYAKVKTENSGLVFRGDFDFNALPYSFRILDSAAHGYELDSEGKTYVRAGTAAPWGKDFGGKTASAYSFAPFQTEGVPSHELITSVKIGDSELKNISRIQESYAMPKSSEKEEIVVSAPDGVEITINDMREKDCCIVEGCFGKEIQKMYICFLDEQKYISDLKPKSKNGEVFFNKNALNEKITVMGDRWRGEPDKEFEKGIAVKGNSEIVYDVSEFKNHVVSFTVARDLSSAMGGRGGWAEFGKEANFQLYGDGELIASADRISMRSGSSTIKADISEIRELKLVVSGDCEAVWAGGEIAQRELVFLFGEQDADGKFQILIGNPTAEDVTPMLYTTLENGAVSSLAQTVHRGEVKEFVIPCDGKAVHLLDPASGKTFDMNVNP